MHMQHHELKLDSNKASLTVEGQGQIIIIQQGV